MTEPTRVKPFAESAFLVIVTIFLAHSIWAAAVKTHGFAIGEHALETDRCEIFLELSDSMDLLSRVLGSHAPLETMRDANAQAMLEAAAKCLNEAASTDPNDANILAKLVILRHKQNLNSHEYYGRLTKLHTSEACRLVDVLTAVYGLSTAKLPQQTEAKENATSQIGYKLPQATKRTKLPDAATSKSLQSYKRPPDDGSLVKSITNSLPVAWFTEHATLDWQKRTGQFKQALLTQKSIDEKAQSFLIVFGSFVLFGLLALFIGTLIVIVQLFLIGRQVTPADQLPWVLAPANYGWLQIYKVFVLWLLTQIVVGTLAKPLMPGTNANALAMSLYIMLSYTISNAAAIFYIYWYGLRPHGITLLEGLKFRVRVGKTGPGGMVLWGIGAWFACLPLVFFAYLIASRYLGSHGSSNPVVAKIREAVHAQDPLAIILFYITTGLIAPLCEESLFRGFLYPSLRRVMNVPLAILLSASLFSVAHLDVGAMLPLFALGCVFAFVVEKTKSIVPSIIAHGMWNSGTITLVLLILGG